MIYRKRDSKKFTIPGGTSGFIYKSDKDGDFTIARVKMNGKYPAKGYSINNVCKETLLLLEGKLEVEIKGKIYKMKKDDLLTVHPRSKYRIKGKGLVVDIITPAWEKNKNRIVEN